MIDVLDAKGKVLKAMPRDEVHRKGLLHRCVHIFVFDPAGRLWLQKRSIGVRLYPGKWTSSASGHVDAGEREERAALREAKEELRLDLELRRVGEFRFRDENENEISGLYEATTAEIPKAGHDVIAVMALSKAELAALRARLPGAFAPSFGAALAAYGWK